MNSRLAPSGCSKSWKNRPPIQFTAPSLLRDEPNLLREGFFLLDLARERGERRKRLVAVLERDQQVGLIALPDVVVLRLARRRGQLGEAEVGDDLRRQQLVAPLVRLGITRRRLVVPGAEGDGSGSACGRRRPCSDSDR